MFWQKTTPVDGLSQRPRSQEDPEVVEEVDNWIDQAYSFGVKCLNQQLLMRSVMAENRKVKTFPYKKSNLKGERMISPITMVAALAASTLPTPRMNKAKAHDSRLKKIKKFLKDPN
jgi:hypothetical protein